MRSKNNLTKLSARQRVGYLAIRALGDIQAVIHKIVLKEHVWRSADGTCTPLLQITNTHLTHIIKKLVTEGGQPDKLSLIMAEQSRRRNACDRQ